MTHDTAMTAAPRPSLAALARRGLAGGLIGGVLLASVIGSGALAQSIAGVSSRAPVDFDAARIELQDRQNRVVLSGGVIITQGDLRLTADRTTVAYTDTGTLQIQRLDATGGVTVTRGNERASGDAAVYDFNRRVIVLSGGVALRRGADRLDGGRLVIDLNSGVSSVDGRGSRTENNTGRVTGRFTVPDGN